MCHFCKNKNIFNRNMNNSTIIQGLLQKDRYVRQKYFTIKQSQKSLAER